MTSIFDGLPADNGLALGGTGANWVDSDTLKDDQGNLLRFSDISGAETDSLTPEGFKEGQIGGQVQTETVAKLANDLKFTNIVRTGKFGKHGRELIDLQDENGRSFKQHLINNRILDLHPRYADEEQYKSRDYADFLRSDESRVNNEWDAARNVIEQSVDAERQYNHQFKQKAINEQQLAAAPDYYADNVTFKHGDRDLNNMANNPLSKALDTGLIGVKESMYGMLELLGTSTGSDWLKDVGDAGIYRSRAEIGDLPQLKLSAIDEEGNWDIDGVGEFFQYLGNNAAISLPYMAVSIGGALLSPLTGGASLAAPAAIYAGQTWNEMEGEKNAGIAVASGITQAVLDRLGLKGITGSLTSGAVRKKIIGQIAAREGIPKAEAVKRVAGATRAEIAGFADDAGKFAADQLSARNVSRALLTRAGIGAGTEAVTEAAQEATGYLSAVIGSDKEFNAHDLNHRLINASLAGGTLGAGFSVPGTAYDVGAWTDVAVRQLPAEANRRSQAGHWAEQERKEHGRVASVSELAEQTRHRAETRKTQGLTFEEKVQAAKRKKLGRSVNETVGDLWTSIPGLWRGAGRFIFGDDVKNQSRAARILADFMGGQLQKTFSGASLEQRKHQILTEYKNYVTDPSELSLALGKNRAESSQYIQEFYNDVAKGGNINWNSLPPQYAQHRDALKAYHEKLITLGDKIWTDQKKYNPDLGYQKDYLYTAKSFNKAAIEKNTNAFAQSLVEDYGYTRADADALVDDILNTDQINTPGDFSTTTGALSPGAHRKRTLNLAQNPKFAQFMEQDIFQNLSNTAKSAARYITHEQYVGKDGKIVNELLNQMLEEGVAEDKVNDMARQLQDLLDAESGNYKRIKNQTWNNIQKNLMFWTTMAGLPLATLSSFVELALTTRALTKQQIFKTMNFAGVDLAKGVFATMNQFRSREAKEVDRNVRGELLKELGYFEWDVGAATTTGVTETSHAKQQWVDRYFKAIGLQQWTNYTRNIRASVAGDYILGHTETIAQARAAGKYTNATLEAEESLRNLGINVDDAIALYNGEVTGAEADALASEIFKTGAYNFVNEAVALPQAANRPLFYQNPHLALFTQFHGFIATFTANHIPKMWGELVKRGTPGMKYQAFAMMSTMIMLGFASQYLKDLLKYGKASPHLDDTEKLQRAINSSGLLGTGERVLNLFFPLYEQSSSGPAEAFFNTVTGEAAAASNLARAGEAVVETVAGDAQKGFYKGLKATPFVGPFNKLNKTISSAFFGGDDG